MSAIAAKQTFMAMLGDRWSALHVPRMQAGLALHLVHYF